MATPRILVVEDEKDLVDLLAWNLSREGCQIDIALDGETALKRLGEHRPDLVLLDVMLPDMSGTEICRKLKGAREWQSIPVVMVSAKGEEIDRIVGLELGADDYVTKPFSMRELLLRVRAILRRERATGPKPSDPVKRHGRLVLDEDRHRVLVDDQEVPVTSLEFRLLSTLLARVGRVQTRDTLLADVWGVDADIETRTVDAHVKRLRQKLGEAGDCVETVRGVGYRLREEPC